MDVESCGTTVSGSEGVFRVFIVSRVDLSSLLLGQSDLPPDPSLGFTRLTYFTGLQVKTTLRLPVITRKFM